MAKVAVLLATYNGEKYIRELLESLDNQTFQDFHCYIHDDGSSDNTLCIIDNFIKNNKKYELIKGPKTGGATNNFVFLLEQVQDEQYVMFCDQDDIWDKNKIEIEYDAISKLDPNHENLVFTDLRVVDSTLSIIDDSFFHYSNRDNVHLDVRHLLRKNVAPGCTMIINRLLVERSLKYKALLREAMFDWGIMLLAASYGEIVCIDMSTISYRQHDGNVVGAKVGRGLKNFFKDVLFLLSGEKGQAIKENIALERNHAVLLVEEMDQDNVNYAFLQEMSQIYQKKKHERMRFYVDNNLVGDNKCFAFLRLLYV